MSANWSGRTLSHATPAGCRKGVWVSISSISVAMKASAESWLSMTTSDSSTTCEEWTVVAIGVELSTRPSSRKIPCSRSAKPAPLPVRPPRRVTATQPTTQKSSLGMSSKPTLSPCSKNPCAVAAVSKSTPVRASFSGSMRR